jgi:hypothetical protein
MSRRAGATRRSDGNTRRRSVRTPGPMALVWITVARGVMAIVLGLALALHRDRAPAALVNFMGVYWILNGIVTFQWGLAVEGPRRRLPLAAGAIGTVTGAVVLVAKAVFSSRARTAAPTASRRRSRSAVAARHTSASSRAPRSPGRRHDLAAAPGRRRTATGLQRVLVRPRPRPGPARLLVRARAVQRPERPGHRHSRPAPARRAGLPHDGCARLPAGADVGRGRTVGRRLRSLNGSTGTDGEIRRIDLGESRHRLGR